MCPLFYAQEYHEITDAWEYSDSLNNTYDIEEPQPLFNTVIFSLISLYRNELSAGSISRCPFAVSCSAFCFTSVKNDGLIGLLNFIDRYFYRENVEAYIHYELVQKDHGVLKLDDQFFLQ